MEIANILKRFIAVLVDGRSYLNLVYLMLAFPLGLTYFIFFVTGFSLGISLLIIWVGLLVLLGVMAVLALLIKFERKLAGWLLGLQLPAPAESHDQSTSLWKRFTLYIKNPLTWKGLAFLLARFPLGVATFSIMVALLALSGTLLAAPLLYRFLDYQIMVTWVYAWRIDTLGEALLLSAAGGVMAIASLHAGNGLAWIYRKLARALLA